MYGGNFMKKYEIDMCNGPLFKQFVFFAIPLIFSEALQLLFNAADTVVVGKFAGESALAAVGSTSSLINLLLNLVIGLSMGAGVVVAKNYGSKDKKAVQESVHTAIATAIASGIIMLFAGLFLTKPLLRMMKTPEDIINLSSLYIIIYFLGMPANMLYNFGASVLRAAGDTKRPLFILTFAGVINVLLNLLLVIVFNLSVAGVAIATITAETISAFLILRILTNTPGMLRLKWKSVKIHRDRFLEIVKIGLPAGVQGILFNISNVLIQSSVNSFGPLVIAANTASVAIEGFVNTSLNALYQATLNFTSQNYGAKKFARIDKILTLSLILSFICGGFFGFGAYIFGTPLLSIWISSKEAISYGLIRLSVIGISYSLCGLMDAFVGSLRGLGLSIVPTIITLFGACLFRTLWVFTIFENNHTLYTLYMSYPISWILTSGTLGLYYLYERKKLFKTYVSI